jgi:hypothetical protein
VQGPKGPVAVNRDTPGGPGTAAGAPRIVSSTIGRYVVTADGKKELRVAALAARELDTRPRAATAAGSAASLGDTRSQVDASWVIAFALLGIMTVELGLRVWLRRRADAV